MRLHWIKYHLEERQPEHLQVFSVKDKVAIRTYLYDVQESYVIVLEPRGDNRIIYWTAYYLLGRNRYKIEHKLKRRLAKCILRRKAINTSIYQLSDFLPPLEDELSTKYKIFIE